MNLNLNSLNRFRDTSGEPTSIEFIYFLFFEHGISLKEFQELPIPYIQSILKTQLYKNKKIEEGNKKK